MVFEKCEATAAVSRSPPRRHAAENLSGCDNWETKSLSGWLVGEEQPSESVATLKVRAEPTPSQGSNLSERVDAAVQRTPSSRYQLGRCTPRKRKYYGNSKPSNTLHDVRTGTWRFMAGEIASGRYHFRPARSIPRLPMHNPLHDLESCWWGISWKIFRNTVPVPEHEDDYRMASRYLFSSTGAKLEAFARAYYFNSSDTFYEVI
ncbi:hypothetical protein FRB95_014093 [Tulasnella sp. JGI-2019a]|nr:hypothetical protein FRB95_014093 [Tulasnella sp. JGI-2019a]